MKKSKRIFMGITETSGYYGRLYKGLKELGVDCFFAQLIPNANNYIYSMPCDNWMTKLCRKYYGKNQAIYNIGKTLVFLWALFKYDTFVITNYYGFWNNINMEFKLLKLLGKKRVMLYLGTFTRLPYADGFGVRERTNYCRGKTNVKAFVELVINKGKSVEETENNTDIRFNLPAQAQLSKKRFISISYLGVPIDIEDKCEETDDRKTGRKVRILHAPSNWGCKGTDEFRKCICELKKKYDIEYIEISGVSNRQVLEEIKKCDFVLDQLYSDTPLATFASEAAYYGKPAIVGGYFAEYYKNYYPNGSCPPTMYVQPEKLYEAVEKMIYDVPFRKRLGMEAQAFVKKYMNSKAVAKRFYKAINGDIASEWIIDPLKVGYLEGCGVKREVQRQIIIEMYNKCGIEKMGTVGNPLLTQKIMEVVHGGEEKL